MNSPQDSPAAAALYAVEHAGKKVSGPSGELVILRDVDFTVAKGEMLAIVGASGSGKSTLLHLLGTLDRATSGRVLFEGRDLAVLTPDEAAAFRSRELGFVFQFHHLLPEFTTVENVAMQAIIAGVGRKQALEMAAEALERFGMGHRSGHSVATLSGGERQRAAIARATLMNPKVLLADEPTGNLDESTGERVAEALEELNRKQGMTLVVVTHNSELAAGMDRCLELRDGEIYA